MFRGVPGRTSRGGGSGGRKAGPPTSWGSGKARSQLRTGRGRAEAGAFVHGPRPTCTGQLRAPEQQPHLGVRPQVPSDPQPGGRQEGSGPELPTAGGGGGRGRPGGAAGGADLDAEPDFSPLTSTWPTRSLFPHQAASPGAARPTVPGQSPPHTHLGEGRSPSARQASKGGSRPGTGGPGRREPEGRAPQSGPCSACGFTPRLSGLSVPRCS